jgi:hypothetical protein
MLLGASGQPEHSSRAVRTRPIWTNQLRLLKTLHGKATRTQKRYANLVDNTVHDVSCDVTILVSDFGFARLRHGVLT